MPKCFGALFFRGFIFGQNAKGGGGKAIAKRFGALLKIFLSWIHFKEFWIWAKCPREGGGLGVPKSLEHFFSGFLPLKAFQKGWNEEKCSNVYNIFRGQQY